MVYEVHCEKAVMKVKFLEFLDMLFCRFIILKALAVDWGTPLFQADNLSSGRLVVLTMEHSWVKIIE
jgi:hypothetical protein